MCVLIRVVVDRFTHIFKAAGEIQICRYIVYSVVDGLEVSRVQGDMDSVTIYMRVYLDVVVACFS